MTLFTHFTEKDSPPPPSPAWTQPGFYIHLVCGNLGLLFCVWLVAVAGEHRIWFFLHHPFGWLVLCVEVVLFFHAWSAGSVDAQSQDHSRWLDWLESHPDEMMQLIDGQAYGDRLLHTKVLQLLHVQKSLYMDELHVYCLNRQGDLLCIKVQPVGRDDIRVNGVDVLDKADQKGFFLKQSRKAFETLYGTPDSW